MDCGLAAIDVELLIGIVLRIVFGAGPECILDRFLVVAGLAAAFRCSGRLAALTVLFVLGVGLLGRLVLGVGLRTTERRLLDPCLIFRGVVRAFALRNRGGDRDVATGYQRKRGGCWPDKRTEVGFY